MTATMATDEPRAYVVGFMFSPDFKNVLLIRKLRPEWQRGLFNGIGGKIEPGELPIEAMIREAREEAALFERAWMEFHVSRFRHGATVHYFAAAFESLQYWQTCTDEEVCSVPVNPLPADVIYNLPYLVPMALILLRQPLHNIPVLEVN